MGSKPKIPVWKYRDAILHSNLPALTKLLLLAISHHLSDASAGRIVKASDLARETSMSERSVTTHIKTAISSGLLAATFEHDAKGHRSAYKFTPIMPESYADLTANPASREPDLDAPSADSEASLGANDDNLPAADAVSQPSLGAGDAPQVCFQEKSFLSFQERELRPKRSSRRASQQRTLDPTAELDPDSDGMRFALDAGLTTAEASLEFEKFRDHHIAKGNRFADWMAAWRNWVRRSREYRRLPNSRGRSSLADLASAACEHSEEMT